MSKLSLSGRVVLVRPMKLMAAGAVALAAVAGCGGSKATTKTTTTVTVAATTTTVPQAGVEVRPSSGPVGTSFQLLATRFQPAEMVVFEIDFPGGNTFKGQTHKAGTDGSVSATYRVTSGNPSGTYQVKATGDKGTQATGQFTVTAAGSSGSSSTTAVGHTSSTLNPNPTTSTTKKP